MFTEISWGEYLFSTLIITLLYYMGVLFLKFRIQIKELFLNSYSGDHHNDAIDMKESIDQLDVLDNSQTISNKEEINSPANDSAEIDQFIEDIQDAFSNRENLERNSVEKLLLELFNTYSNIKQSSYRSSINELIQSEGEKYGHVMPSEAEIDVLWDEQA